LEGQKRNSSRLPGSALISAGSKTRFPAALPTLMIVVAPEATVAGAEAVAEALCAVAIEEAARRMAEVRSILL
jgi:hypothetical protein